MKPRTSTAALVIIGAAAAAAVGVLGWELWRTRDRSLAVLTDGATIREEARLARPRDILWQPAEPVPGPLNSSGQEYEPKLSADGLTMVLVRGKAGRNADLHESRWTPTGWTDPQPISALNTEADELGPELSPDGLAIYFYSDRDGGLGGFDLWMARRDPGGPWGPPANLGPAVNSAFNDYGPALAPDASRLYFASNRPGPGDPRPDEDAWPATIREQVYRHDYDLYSAEIGQAGLADAVPIAALNSPANEGAPAASPFGDFVYFASDRAGGMGGFDLYRSRLLRGEFAEVEPLGPAINSPANDLDPALTMGGFALVFSSDRPPAEAPRAPAVDAAGDAATDPAPQAAAAGQRRAYDLYRSTSREVFREHELAAAEFDWGRVLPLLWLLTLLTLLALLLLLLFKLWEQERFRRLSLLAKCLLLSVLIHGLLLMALAYWQVRGSIEGFLKRPGGVRVSLAATRSADDVAAQVRGELTEVSYAPAEAPAPDRAEARLETAEAVMRAIDHAAAAAPAPRPAIEPPRADEAHARPDPMPTDPARDRAAPAARVEVAAPADEAPRSERAEPAARPVRPAELSDASPRAALGVTPAAATPGPEHARPRVDVTRAPMPEADAAAEAPARPAVDAPAFDPAAPAVEIAAPTELALPEESLRDGSGDPGPAEASASIDPARPSAPAARLSESAPARDDVPAHSAPTDRVATDRARLADLPAAHADEARPAPRRASDGPVSAADTMPTPSLTVPAPAEAAVAPAGSAPEQAVLIEAPAPAVPGRALLPAAPEHRRASTVEPAPDRVSAPPRATDAVVTPDDAKPDRRPGRGALPDSPPVVAPPSAGLPTLALPTDEPPADLPAPALVGRVLDAATLEPITGATVRLDLPDGPVVADVDAEGRFELRADDLPRHVAVSASAPGYTPASVSLAAEALAAGAEQDFLLTPVERDVIALEADPQVHHVGNDQFSGRINSQFQRASEGLQLSAVFVLGPDQIPPAVTGAEVVLLAKGAQAPNEVRINGRLVPGYIQDSPDDGSFGEFVMPFPAGWLVEGNNSISIRSMVGNADQDDFEFVNVRIRQHRAGATPSSTPPGAGTPPGDR